MRNIFLFILVEERGVTLLCLCEEEKNDTLYQEICGEASDCKVTVSVFQSRVKFYKDYYGILQAGKNGITISVEEFQEFRKFIPKL